MPPARVLGHVEVCESFSGLGSFALKRLTGADAVMPGITDPDAADGRAATKVSPPTRRVRTAWLVRSACGCTRLWLRWCVCPRDEMFVSSVPPQKPARPVVWVDWPDEHGRVTRFTATIVLMCRVNGEAWTGFCLMHSEVKAAVRQPAGSRDRDCLPYAIVAGSEFGLIPWQYFVSRAAVLPALRGHAGAAPRVLGSTERAKGVRARFEGRPLFLVDLC